MRTKAVAVTLLGAALWRACVPDPASIAGTWSARNELVYYDHLERIVFETKDRGRASWGWEQNVHFTSRFRFAEAGSKLAIQYLDRPAKDVRRELGFVLDRGNYRFERDTPAGHERTVCRRRLSFDASPFPPGTAKTTVYYAECTKA